MDISNTSRLQFHFVTAADADFLWLLDQDDEVMKYVGGHKTSKEAIADKFIPRIQAFADKDKGWGLWRVSEVNAPHDDLGWILVRPLGFFTGNRDDENMELGWRFHRKTWGQGIATEAAAQVKAALMAQGYRRFSAIALPENTASIAVMKKLGMTFSHLYHYQDAAFDDEVVVYQLNIEEA